MSLAFSWNICKKDKMLFRNLLINLIPNPDRNPNPKSKNRKKKTKADQNIDKELTCFETMTVYIQVLHTTITPTPRFTSVHRLTFFRFSVMLYMLHWGLVHTMPDKFENATLRAKTEQMFYVHTWKRNKCFASTLERFRWLFTFKIWQFEL